MKLLHGDVSSSVDHNSGKKLILAGREVVVECAGQWRQEVKITASLLTGDQSVNMDHTGLIFLKSFNLSQMDGTHLILSERGKGGRGAKSSSSSPRWRTSVRTLR